MLTVRGLILSLRTINLSSGPEPFLSAHAGSPEAFDDELAKHCHPSHPLRTLGSSFNRLFDLDSTSPLAGRLASAVQRLALYTMAVDEYVNSRENATHISILGEHRNYVVYQFNSLFDDFDNEIASSHRLLYVTHCAAMIYR
jgi:hypothetical protein